MSATWMDRVEGRSRERVLAVLRYAERLGCTVSVPSSERSDYLNIQPPSISTRSGRVASINVHTGSLEFQNGSADRLSDSRPFRVLAAGRKAAITLENDEAVAAAFQAFDEEATW